MLCITYTHFKGKDSIKTELIEECVPDVALNNEKLRLSWQPCCCSITFLQNQT
jgi:hypothetical protein